MNGPEVFVPLGLFAMIGGIVWVVAAYGARTRAAFHDTVRAAIERGEGLSPETIKALGAPRRNRYADIKAGIVLIAIAAACIVFGWAIYYAEGDVEAVSIFTGISAFPGFVGLALLGYGVATRGRNNE